MIPLVQIRDLSFHFGERAILNHIELDIDQGTTGALIGPNGAGKTTLLRILAGTLTPSAGEVLLEGRSFTNMPRRERAKHIALVPQSLDVPFEFTVQQIVEQGRTPYLGMLRGLMREDRIAVDRAVDLTDLASLRHRIFNELSGGERQRVKIALGLAQQPRLLLLDEPTQSLDIGRQVELIDLLASLHHEGVTVLASIHDLHLVPGNFAAVHLLEPGQPLVSGSPEIILTPSQLSRAFHCTPGRHPLLQEAL
ncbi:iron complex transport system ATP-binding protein [Granulicella rosea]|uniref:Iron complex transport system ATP-binding protein n=1 Tax=Granulicella rosea TaxID=474952 RepID=A0A239IMF7_9BACT|nr:ABC transporter ATP-binding protein [Granulicella rosea]SNS94572.1 iron complex transport system ATP-binding protein [Granulicella rosea]